MNIPSVHRIRCTKFFVHRILCTERILVNGYFSSKNISDVVCLSGEWDETEFNIFLMKEPGYNIMLMLK